MFQNSLQVLSPIIGLFINVSFQVVSFRYISNLALLKSVFLGFTVGLLCIFMLEFYALFTLSISSKDFLYILIVNFITYSSLGYCYFHFINLGETARRIRILRELYDSKDGLSTKEILERYNAKDIVEIRIKRLVNNGQIIYKKDRYYVGMPIMLLMAKIIVTMKQIVLGKRSEFDFK